MSTTPPYIIINKQVGETPLQALERYRATRPELTSTPMAYAGRLDPMASGALLILIGEECKCQSLYHQLDKAYDFSLLLGVSSDTQDILGRLQWVHTPPSVPASTSLKEICHNLTGSITLPYPHFSAKTVKGKPLHVWTLEGRLGEIELPTRTSRIYRLEPQHVASIPATTLYHNALTRINSLPTVTEHSKALGADFRREAVRADWQAWYQAYHDQSFPLIHCRCLASSGTYMRSLAALIGKKLGSQGLAYSIHRLQIGRYQPLWGTWGVWTKRLHRPLPAPDIFLDTSGS